MEDLERLNGRRPSELHAVIAWDGKKHAKETQEYVENELKGNFEIVHQELIELDEHTEEKLAKSIYQGWHPSRVINGCIYLVVIRDTNPIYEWQQKHESAGKHILNVNMKVVKQNMRKHIGGKKTAYFCIHTSYNLEETLLTLEPLNLVHLIDRPTFDNFQELFNMLNNDNNLEYVVQRSFHELDNAPSFFKNNDVDVLVNDYYYFKAITGARSLNKKHMLENNDCKVDSKIHIGGEEITFNIRYVGDDYVDSTWERNMLDRRISHKVNDEVEIYIPSKEDELYGLLYNILVQKKRSSHSKHIPRAKHLLNELKLGDLDFEKNIDSSWESLKSYMNDNEYSFKKPKDRDVLFFMF
jgi:hypothetical protein